MVVTANRSRDILQHKEQELVLWLENVEMSDVALVDGKNASLGEMIQQLTTQGINVPGGFATTAYAYHYFIQQAGLESQLCQLFRDLDVDDLNNLRSHGQYAIADQEILQLAKWACQIEHHYSQVRGVYTPMNIEWAKLGLDHDSSLVAHLFDERNPGVKAILQMAIAIAKFHQRKIGICGQAPSDYPEFAQFLVEQGIDSISLNSDSLVKTRLKIAEVEAQLTKDQE